MAGRWQKRKYPVGLQEKWRQTADAAPDGAWRKIGGGAAIDMVLLTELSKARGRARRRESRGRARGRTRSSRTRTRTRTKKGKRREPGADGTVEPVVFRAHNQLAVDYLVNEAILWQGLEFRLGPGFLWRFDCLTHVGNLRQGN